MFKRYKLAPLMNCRKRPKRANEHKYKSNSQQELKPISRNDN